MVNTHLRYRLAMRQERKSLEATGGVMDPTTRHWDGLIATRAKKTCPLMLPYVAIWNIRSQKPVLPMSHFGVCCQHGGHTTRFELRWHDLGSTESWLAAMAQVGQRKSSYRGPRLPGPDVECFPAKPIGFHGFHGFWGVLNGITVWL